MAITQPKIRTGQAPKTIKRSEFSERFKKSFLDPAFRKDELDPILWRGKLMIFYQLVRSFHETHSPSFIYRRV